MIVKGASTAVRPNVPLDHELTSIVLFGEKHSIVINHLRAKVIGDRWSKADSPPTKSRDSSI